MKSQVLYDTCKICILTRQGFSSFSLFKLSQAKIFKKSKQQIPLLKDLISTEYTSASWAKIWSAELKSVWLHECEPIARPVVNQSREWRRLNIMRAFMDSQIANELITSVITNRKLTQRKRQLKGAFKLFQISSL